MNEKSIAFVDCFINGELARDELRRAIYLSVHDETFREQVRTTLVLRELVRLSYSGVPGAVEHNDPA